MNEYIIILIIECIIIIIRLYLLCVENTRFLNKEFFTLSSIPDHKEVSNN